MMNKLSSIGSSLGLVPSSDNTSSLDSSKNIIESIDNSTIDEIKTIEENDIVNSVNNIEEHDIVNSVNKIDENYENIPEFTLSTIDKLQEVLGNTPYDVVRKALYLQYGLITKEEEDIPNLYMITYNKSNRYTKNKVELTKEQKEIVSHYRGIIVEKDTNKPVCYTFSKMGRHFSDDIKLEDCKVMSSYDGSQIKAFFNTQKNNWVISTTRRIDSSKSFYFTNKSFYDMWNESISIDYNTLDKNCCYSFILQHPDNHVVARHSKANIIHVLTRNMNTFKLEDVNIGIKRPEKLTFSNKNEIWKSIKRMQHYKEGYVVQYNDTFVKLINIKYKEIKDLRGSSYSLLFHYFCLKKENKLRKYISYYPEMSETFSNYEKLFYNTCVHVYNEYAMVRIRKILDVTKAHSFMKPILYKLHGSHITKKHKIRLNYVIKHLEFYPPQLLKSLVEKCNNLPYSYY